MKVVSGLLFSSNAPLWSNALVCRIFTKPISILVSLALKTKPTGSVGLRILVSFESSCLNSYFYSPLSNSVSFMNKIFKTGSKRSLRQEDLGGMSKHINSKSLYDQFQERYKKQLQKPRKKRSIFLPIVRASNLCSWYVKNDLFFISRFTAIFTFFIVICLTFLPTFIMKALINDLSSEEGDPNYLGIHSFCLFSIHRHYYSLDLHCGFLGGPHCGCLRYQPLSNAHHPNWCPDEVHGFGSPLSQGSHSQLNGKG